MLQLKQQLGAMPSSALIPRTPKPAKATTIAASGSPCSARSRFMSKCTIASRASRKQCRVLAAEYVGGVTSHPSFKYGVVVARFNSLVTKQLLQGAHETFSRHGVPSENVDVAWVPGSFELPVVAKQMAKSGKYHAVVCIGAIIQGATSHYDAVVSAATSGCLNASTDSGVPVVFGVLTTDNLEQAKALLGPLLGIKDKALDRSGGKVGNKGGEAALTAIEMANLMGILQAEGKAAPARPTA